MTPIPQTLEQAVTFHQAGDWQRAERYYRYILQSDPQHVEALHWLGVLCHQTGRDDLAIAHISEALRLRPDLPQARNNLGSVFLQQGRLDEAVACFRQSLQLNPDYADAYHNLGHALLRQKKLDEAAATLKQCLRLKPDRALAHYHLSLVLREQGKLDDAAHSFQEALRLKPDLAEILAGLAAGSETTTRGRIVVEVAAGELIDKITILQIKSERLTEAGKLANVRKELEALLAERARSIPPSAELDILAAELKQVNEALWQIEDDIRLCEREADFSQRFIELARSVYHRNDHRAALKRRIDMLLGSRFVEEKSYASYTVLQEPRTK